MVTAIHDRMPVILDPEHFLWWLQARFEPQSSENPASTITLDALTREQALRAHDVSAIINFHFPLISPQHQPFARAVKCFLFHLR